MTLLGHKGDKEPYCCGVCGREAGSYGVVPNDKAPIMWLCRDPSCLEIAERIYSMKAKELSRYEAVAVSEALQKSAEKIFDAVLTSLFAKEVRNLEDLTPEKFTAALKSALDDGELTRTMAGFMESYAASIKKQINGFEPPF